MKSISLIFFTLSIVCIVTGYMEKKIINKQKDKIVEYRFIPREIIESQFSQLNLEKSFSDIFGSDTSSFSKEIVY